MKFERHKDIKESLKIGSAFLADGLSKVITAYGWYRIDIEKDRPGIFAGWALDLFGSKGSRSIILITRKCAKEDFPEIYDRCKNTLELNKSKYPEYAIVYNDNGSKGIVSIEHFTDDKF